MKGINAQMVNEAYRLWTDGKLEDSTMKRLAKLVGKKAEWEAFADFRISTDDLYRALLQAVE